MQTPQERSLQLIVNMCEQRQEEQRFVLAGSLGRAILLGESIDTHYGGSTLRDVDLIDRNGSVTGYYDLDTGLAPIDCLMTQTLRNNSNGSWTLKKHNQQAVGINFDEQLLGLREVAMPGVTKPVTVIGNPRFAELLVRTFPHTAAKHATQADKLADMQAEHRDDITELFHAYEQQREEYPVDGSVLARIYDAAHLLLMSHFPYFAQHMKQGKPGAIMRRAHKTDYLDQNALEAHLEHSPLVNKNDFV